MKSINYRLSKAVQSEMRVDLWHFVNRQTIFGFRNRVDEALATQLRPLFDQAKADLDSRTVGEDAP